MARTPTNNSRKKKKKNPQDRGERKSVRKAKNAETKKGCTQGGDEESSEF